MNDAKQFGTVWIRILLCIVILGAGVGGFVILKKQKKPPAQNHVSERPLAVDAVRVEPVNLPVLITGFGEISSRTIVPLSAEVSGRVTSVHPRLEEGEIIQKDEILLTIDERDYRLDYDTARTRLKTLGRDLELAAGEFARTSRLYEQNKVGTLSTVEKAESAVNSITDRISQVEQAMRQAELRLERCVIRAPFTCRITEVGVEQDEYVTPGKKLLTLADDSDLEVIVSLDSRDVMHWLKFDSEKNLVDSNWFERLESVPCRIIWTEDDKVNGMGRVDRVVRFDRKTRTILVAVRLEKGQDASFPLVDGMFCTVTISGRELESVFVLPRQAVTFENTVYVAVNDRLQTRSVTVARLEKGRALVSDGLGAGDIVVTTRLEQPLENLLLSVTLSDDQGR